MLYIALHCSTTISCTTSWCAAGGEPNYIGSDSYVDKFLQGRRGPVMFSGVGEVHEILQKARVAAVSGIGLEN